jgi:hypothetical protein
MSTDMNASGKCRDDRPDRSPADLWTRAVTASSYVLTVAFSLTQKVTGLWNFAQAGTMNIAFYNILR